MSKIDIINPMEYISSILESSGYGSGLEVGHIEYDKSTNKEFHHQIIKESTHDGTILFTANLIGEALLPLINKHLYFKDSISEEELMSLKDVNYVIGDIELESEYGVKASFGTGVKDTISIPVKVEYIF
ncbi:hypothetical protein [Paraliobacillus ryukyuensis]|uniref:hypothetical protein n=1 Tax=Paraliobacillus ryukyuensis TaxID=200904 RepID=UPI0009A77E7E|nr:hypothetical protein [Paraliobacillus ryukyuensis]